MGCMRKPLPARHRTTDGPSDKASLRKRGSLPIWFCKDMPGRAPPDGSPARPAVFADAAIRFCLTIKVLFKLPLRQTTGMVASLLKRVHPDWAVPGATTRRRRQKTPAVRIPCRCAPGDASIRIRLRDIGEMTTAGDGVPAGATFR